MYSKKISKIYAGCALSMAFAIAATPINALAAEGDGETPAAPANTEVNTVNPGTTAAGDKDAKADDPTKLTGLDPTSDKDDPDTADKNEAYTDTDIDVWGYTEDGTVYSVDVEWGAMTFQYETSSWDPETHEAATGAGWVVYDNVNDKVLGDVQDAINRITVTNHSNAAVYAKLTYAGEADYTATTGTFAASDADRKTDTNTAEDFNATFDDTKGVITLQTADNGAGEAGAGKATVGNVYFMPTGIDNTLVSGDSPAGIEQWTKIGKITVSLLTETPAEGGTEEDTP